MLLMFSASRVVPSVLSGKLLFYDLKKNFVHLRATSTGSVHRFAPPCPFSPHPPSAPSPKGEGQSILVSFMPLTFSSS